MAIDPFFPFMLRVILGSLFFFQAYDKVFRIGLSESYLVFQEDSERRNIPIWFLKFSVALSSFIELIAGFMLIIGFFQSYAMTLLGINLIMLTIGFGYLQGLWDMRHVFPRIILLSVLYLIPLENQVWSLDHLMGQFI
tara:strand:+ start:8756 stop:9169 length:414 start_codon:yes stop_codon:yes gene_type:complete